ncbi:uncharacterized protein LOC123675040 [Harmonia axyridis]|uniref:uncharacterized protein LOC123675040 n=1 Tax=Harmonia axyridis TaxID=115357 RepID=UPI001E276255|nr:uncharacterized protein LOC123675040 [Harmonia axyridis]
MHFKSLLVVYGLLLNVLSKPTNDTDELKKLITDDIKTQMEPESKIFYSDSSKASRTQSSTNNPLSVWQNLIGSPISNSQSLNAVEGMHPVMVLGMHQAIVIPLNALPSIFQNMMTGLFNTENSNQQQSGNLTPGLPNIMG